MDQKQKTNLSDMVKMIGIPIGGMLAMLLIQAILNPYQTAGTIGSFFYKIEQSFNQGLHGN